MSKSKDNYIGIAEPAFDMFGKTMSISDEQMWRWYDLLSMKGEDELSTLRQAVADGMNPRDAKIGLAKEIVTRFHSAAAAEAAAREFMQRFQAGTAPAKCRRWRSIPQGMGVTIAALLKQAGLAPSTSEAVRNVEQGGVKIDGAKVSDRARLVTPGTYVLQVGKRKWARVTIG
jgi:tyrosyl-tRNA synthetase